MIFDFLLIAICFYLSIPAVVAYTAASYGRSFRTWFFLGLILPIISHVILYHLISKDIKAKKLITMMKKEEIVYMEGEIEKAQQGLRRREEPIDRSNYFPEA